MHHIGKLILVVHQWQLLKYVDMGTYPDAEEDECVKIKSTQIAAIFEYVLRKIEKLIDDQLALLRTSHGLYSVDFMVGRPFMTD